MLDRFIICQKLRQNIRVFQVVATAIFGLALSSCSPLEEQLINQGIGTKLYSNEAAEETRLLERYLRFMCVQGGLGAFDEQGEPRCHQNLVTEHSWTILVRAGFNDIDRRCDSYLAWLNSKRRTNNAVLSQLSQSGTAMQSILSIAGSSATPIALAGVAFGIARDTFTNYYSRLLLEVESSTVERVVIENRFNFRQSLSNRQIQFKPDAIYVLRSYLLLCTPHVIEENINSRTRFSVAGNLRAPQDNDPAQVMSALQSRGRIAATAQSLIAGTPERNERGTRTRTIIKTERQVVHKEAPRVRTGPGGGKLTDVESGLLAIHGSTIRSSVCNPGEAVFNKSVRNSLEAAKKAANFYNRQASLSRQFSNEQGNLSTPTELQFFMTAQPCSLDRTGTPRGYQNVFEKYGFPNRQAIVDLQMGLFTCETKLDQNSSTAGPPSNLNKLLTGVFDEKTRTAIKKIKSRLRKQDLVRNENEIEITTEDSLDEVKSCKITYPS